MESGTYVILKEKDLKSIITDSSLLTYDNINGFKYNNKKIYIQSPLCKIKVLSNETNVINITFPPDFVEVLKVFNETGLSVYKHIYSDYQLFDSTEMEVYNANGQITELPENNSTGYVLLSINKLIPFKCTNTDKFKLNTNYSMNITIHYLSFNVVQLKLSNTSYKFTECVLKDDEE